MSTNGADPLLSVENLKVWFPIKSGIVLDRHVGDIRAVDDVSFEIKRGETVGLVGESGCGKSTVGRTILRLYKPTAGRIVFDGQDITALGEAELRPLRRRMQMIFQDAFASLNPRNRVGRIVGEPLRVHGLSSGREAATRVRELLEIVGSTARRGVALSARVLGRTAPAHRRRAGARAEPGLRRRRRARLGVGRLDPGADHQPARVAADGVRSHVPLHLARPRGHPAHLQPDRGDVPRLDRGDLAGGRALRESPAPVTISLRSAVPIPDPEVERSRRTILLAGELPSPANPPPACRFHTRCPYVRPTRCRDEVPPLRALASGHLVACHWAERIKAGALQPKEVKPVFEPGADAVADAWEPPPV